VIGSIGRLEQEKRYDVLIEAVAAVRRTRPNVYLALAGAGSLAGDLARRARAHGLDAACILAGHRDDAIEFFHALDVFVQSSDTEGTPNAVLEAMAMETPIVATDVGGTGDVIAHGTHALLTPRRDPAAMAAAVDETLARPEATAARVAAARA